MRASKKIAYSLQLEREAQQEDMYRQMAEAEAEAARRRGRPTLCLPIMAFSTEGRLIKLLQPFFVYAEPLNGGVLVTVAMSRAAGFGPDINEAIRKLLAGLEHRYFQLHIYTGSMSLELEDELRYLSQFIAFK